ncbi:hypothetical protein Brsp01_44130 [Brucella sp. NBRC 12950]|nr:hypothetical protein Brsp01_44130 [Brucella sp. NBRC 12950]
MPQTIGKADAAPATVSGKLMSRMSLGFSLGRRREAMTREPGDLPSQSNVHGRGVPVCRSEGRVAVPIAMSSLTHAPNFLG